jgi:hypothetical protein
MKYIHATLEKQFIFALKSNRLIALNKEDKANGRYTHITSLFILCYLTFSFFTLSFYVTKLGRLFDSFKGNRQACFL